MTSPRRAEVDLLLDADGRGPRLAGILRRAGSGQRADLSFEYAAEWLEAAGAYALEPALELRGGEQRRRTPGLHGIFADASPDRWGRHLLERREALEARTEGRPARAFDAWDFLLAVSDATRMGAIRLRPSADAPFVDGRERAVPPKAGLRELEAVAARIDAGERASDTQLAAWLEQLIAPGASLGGSRPKASFEDEQGVLWLAKFPAATDRRDVGAWEFVQNRLAARAGINVPATDLLSLGRGYRTFAARRFDRDPTHRRHFASAMTLLERHDHEAGASYLDIAAAIERHAPPLRPTIDEDLEELFRRVVFNALAGHRDDHLRNHGFLHDGRGWRLSPAFDLNPIPDKHEHEPTFDGRSAVPDLDLIRATAPLYRLSEARQRAIVAEVAAAASSWREVAREVGIGRSEQDLMAPAYALAAS